MTQAKDASKRTAFAQQYLPKEQVEHGLPLPSTVLGDTITLLLIRLFRENGICDEVDIKIERVKQDRKTVPTEGYRVTARQEVPYE
jgi:hypothetical protein